MKIKNIIFNIVLALMFLLTSCSSKNVVKLNVEARPNIIIIMADDLGFSDLGCYGGEINTPNLDALASNGLRFNSFYNTSRCCPTRASLLTGLQPHQAGIGRMTMNMGLPGYQGTLGNNTVTLAEVLKTAGYQTGMTGKWHVSETQRLEKDRQLKWLAHQEDYGAFSDTLTYPTARGFDKYYGNIWGVVDYFDPFSLVNGTKPVKELSKDFYYTKAIGDTAVAYVEQFSKTKEPFFLYIAHCAPHWPLQAPQEEIIKYKNTYNKGWRAIRKSRYENLIEKGILRGDIAKLSPFMFPELNWEDNPDKEWDANAMAVHAAMVDIMDQTIGDLVKKLEDLGKLDNTVIFFLSDNGASYETPSKYGPGFDRVGTTRDGKQIVFPVDKKVLSGPQTVYSGIREQWANTLNTPFRFWKSKVYEGGIASPLIVHWPNKIKDKGAIREQKGHVVDFMATVLDLANASYPKLYNDNAITPSSGKSLIPIITENINEDSSEILFWEHFGSAALRQGDWKIVRLNSKSEWELYDLSKDRTELKNLAIDYPEKVNKLSEKWNELALQYLVFPAPN